MTTATYSWAKRLTPTQKLKVRNNMSTFCLAAEKNEVNWHYDQDRRFYYVDNPGHTKTTKDCSGYVGNVYWNAMHDTGIFLADPLDYRYTGIGNTWSAEAFLREHGKRVTEVNGFLIGDIVRWGTGRHSHMAVCRKAGSARIAIFSSFGWEGGPLPEKLNYRNDLIGVWRHPALV